MSLEVFLSALLTSGLLAMAYRCRRSFAAAHLIPLGMFCVALTLLKATFGATADEASEETLLFAYGAIALYAVSLFFVTRLIGGRSLESFGRWVITVKVTRSDLGFALLTLATLWALRVYKGLEYGIVFSGSGTEEAILALPYWLSTMDSVWALLGGGALIMLVVTACRKGKRWFWALIALEVLWTFISAGRREVVLLTAVFLWIAWQTKFVRMPTALTGLVLSVTLLYIVSPLFLVARQSNTDYLLQGTVPLQALTNAIAASYDECGIGSKCSDVTSDNVGKRSNAMEFMKSLVGAERKGVPVLSGAGMLHSLNWSVPSILAPKPALMTEQFIQTRYGLRIEDDAISVPLLAYADFGLLGCLLAGACVAVYIRVVSRLAFLQRNKLVAIALLYGLVRILWHIEGDPIGFIILLRDGFMLILASGVLGFVRFLTQRAAQSPLGRHLPRRA